MKRLEIFEITLCTDTTETAVQKYAHDAGVPDNGFTDHSQEPEEKSEYSTQPLQQTISDADDQSSIDNPEYPETICTSEVDKRDQGCLPDLMSSH